uniref:Putative tRNA (cytidine(32)/guanosine(34)-2'-O)-methyltransferase n=1 Tax=Meloidogyne incognita TaxID=6306 RepID=A0A914KP36_MELIC
MGKTSKDKRDIYYRLAKEKGWRARSAFKLLQLDESFNVFKEERKTHTPHILTEKSRTKMDRQKRRTKDRHGRRTDKTRTKDGQNTDEDDRQITDEDGQTKKTEKDRHGRRTDKTRTKDGQNTDEDDRQITDEDGQTKKTEKDRHGRRTDKTRTKDGQNTDEGRTKHGRRTDKTRTKTTDKSRTKMDRQKRRRRTDTDEEEKYLKIILSSIITHLIMPQANLMELNKEENADHYVIRFPYIICFNRFSDVTRAVDLCAAPGSWSQVLSSKLYSNRDEEERKQVKIVAVDLQPMSALPGVIQIQGDITEDATAEKIISHFDGQLAQLVVCDGAPDVTGLHAFDEYLQSQLVFSAFNITSCILTPGGTFISKIFRAKNINIIYAQMSQFFKEVNCCKPKSSRQSSCEAFIICQNYSPPAGYEPTLCNPILSANYYDCISSLKSPTNRALVPFMACGDLSGFDSDRTYPLELSKISEEFSDWKYIPRPVVQPPTEPAYKKALGLKKDGSMLNKDKQSKHLNKRRVNANLNDDDEVVDEKQIFYDECDENCLSILNISD